MGLEIQTNKTPGATIRETEGERPQIIGLCIVVMTLIEFVFLGLIMHITLFPGTEQPLLATGMAPEVESQFLAPLFVSEQQIVSMWLAGAFFNLSFIIFLYQRFFMDHLVIAKRRFGKWEDEGVQFE